LVTFQKDAQFDRPINDKDTGSSITDSQLLLIVTGTRDSGTIDHYEQEMIQGVLGLQNQRVKEIMKPRVEIIVVPKEMSVASVLGVVRQSGYSRIPVYDGEIDNIVGIVLDKNRFDVIRKIRERLGSNKDSALDEDVKEELESILMETTSSSSSHLYTTDDMSTVQTPKGKAKYVKPLTGFELAKRMEKSISEAGLIESCYFVPESANGWAVLQEMRRSFFF
jgi:CBS domain containing-hemolysin-like protein